MRHLVTLSVLVCTLSIPQPLFGTDACESWGPGSFSGLITGQATGRQVRAKFGVPRYEANLDRNRRVLEYEIKDPLTAIARFYISRKTERLLTITIDVNLWVPNGEKAKDGKRMALSLLNSPYLVSRFGVVYDESHMGEAQLVRLRKGDNRRANRPHSELAVLEFWRAGATYVAVGGDGFYITFSTDPYDKAYAPCYRVAKTPQ